MPTNVVMPQMGESIFEGTITKWLKKAGDTVERDEPLFEISTDKVDAEIPSPAAGVLTEIKIAEGATVEINTVVAVIAENGNAAASTPASTVDAKKEARQEAVATAPEKAKEPVPAPTAAKSEPAPATPPPPVSASAPAQTSGGTDVVMPQMGESIFEGTITKWLKKVGDTVARDEPLFEISTDKVDAEIPSPAAGVLTDIKVPEGSTVEINTIVAVIGGTAGAAASSPAAPAAPAEKKTGLQLRNRPPRRLPRHNPWQQRPEKSSVPRRWCDASPRRITSTCLRFPAPELADASPRTTHSPTSASAATLPQPQRVLRSLLPPSRLRTQRQPLRKSPSPATWFRSARCAPSSPSAWWNRSTPAPTFTASSRLT